MDKLPFLLVGHVGKSIRALSQVSAGLLKPVVCQFYITPPPLSPFSYPDFPSSIWKTDMQKTMSLSPFLVTSLPEHVSNCFWDAGMEDVILY